MPNKGRMRVGELRVADGFPEKSFYCQVLEIIWEEPTVMSRLQQKHLILLFPVFYIQSRGGKEKKKLRGKKGSLKIFFQLLSVRLHRQE